MISAPAYADTSERYVQEQNVRIGETVIQEQETQNKECIIQTDSFVPFVESQNSEIKENIGIEIAQENDLLNNAQSLEQKDDSGSTAPSEDVSEEQKPFDDESKTEEKPSESEQGNAETVPSNPENNAEEGDKTNRQKVLPIRMMQFLRTVRWKVNLCRLTLLTALRLLTVIHKRVCRLPRRKIQWTIRYPQRIILKKVRM